MKLFENIRILPVFIAIAVFAFVFRAGELAVNINAWAQGLETDRINQDNSGNSTENLMETAQSDTGGMDASDDEISLGNPDVNDTDAESVNLDTLDSEVTYRNVQKELSDDLKDRRKRIIAAERELARKEALLQAAEKELDRKYRELSNLRDEIKSLLEQHSEEEEKRIMRLVKIYEGMKADDAAKIFNTLNIDVLLDVFSRMSERKMSPILAEMTTEKARALTTLLATENKILEFSEDNPQ